MNPVKIHEPPQDPPQEVWGIVSLLGHKQYAGKLVEVERFGNKLGRVEVPEPDGSWRTVFFGASAVYSIDVVTEQVARAVAAKGNLAQPVSAWDFPKALREAIRQEESESPGRVMSCGHTPEDHCDCHAGEDDEDDEDDRRRDDRRRDDLDYELPRY